MFRHLPELTRLELSADLETIVRHSVVFPQVVGSHERERRPDKGSVQKRRFRQEGIHLEPKAKKRTNHDLSPAVFFLVAGIKFVS